jgi:hypothetical protein
MNDIEAVTLRIAALERRHKRMKGVLLALLLPVTAVVFMAAQQAPAVADVIRAKRVEILESGVGGRVILRLAAAPGDPGQGQVDVLRDGKLLAIVGGVSEGGQFMAFQPNGARSAAHHEVGRIYAAENTRRGGINLWDDTDTQIFKAP